MNAAPGSIRLEAQGLSFAYTAPVIRNLSLALRAGRVTGIIGPNGCGKTTVLRLLDGILKPAAGEVILTGSGPLRRLPRRQIARHIAMVPQNGNGCLPQTVFDFAMQGRAPHLSFLGFESTRDEEITRAALEQTRLTRYAARGVSAISGGEKQRLLLARALVQESEILLIDELTANLDVNFQVELMHLIARLTREKNLATLVVSHEINLLSALADSVILMARGEILHEGPPSTVITEANLRDLFELDFTVRILPNGIPEAIPVILR